jgi:uncharacterized integral membrane protein (TIGR00698 family)
MNWLTRNYLGILFALAVAGVSYALGLAVPIVGGPVFGILIGILVNNLVGKPEASAAGLNFTSKKVLQAAVVILGSGLSLRQVLATGQSSLLIIVTTIASAFLATVVAGKLLGVGFNLKSLIGVGTAICGGSAIAAISPIIEAEDQEIAYSISTVFLFNIVAVFLFPALGHLIGLSQAGFGLFAGTAINDTSSVVAAGYIYGNEAGDYATIVKLTRTIMIIPIAVVFALVMMARKRKEAGKTAGVKLDFAKIFPWFILGFLAASALNTFGVLGAGSIAFLKELGKFFITMALAAIGLKTDIRKMLKTGFRPLVLGLVVWMSVGVVSIAVQKLIGSW